MIKKRELVLDNGMQYKSKVNANINSVCISFSFKGGSLYESPEVQGIMHLLEHLLFRKRGNLAQEDIYSIMNSIAAEYRGSTNKDFIYFSLKVSPKYFIKAFDLLLEIMNPTHWTIDDIIAEKKIIINEIRERKSDSFFDKCDKKYWKGTTTSNSILGRKRTINNISIKELEKLHKNVFKPNNGCFIITGNAGLEDENYAIGRLNVLKRGGSKSFELKNITPERFCSRKTLDQVYIEKSNSSSEVLISFDVNLCLVSLYDATVLNNILGGGVPCLITSVLRENYGIIYELYNDFIRFFNTGTFYYHYFLDDNSIITSLQLIFNILAEIKNTITDNMLDESINFYTENLLWEYDDSEAFNYKLCWNEFSYGQKYDVEELINCYKRVTTDSLKIAAKEIFRPENTKISISTRYSNKKIDAIKDRVVGIVHTIA